MSSFHIYNPMLLWWNINNLQTVSGGRHLKISSWQDYRTCMEPRATLIAVQIQDKFQPVIQGTWSRGKITISFNI